MRKECNEYCKIMKQLLNQNNELHKLYTKCIFLNTHLLDEISKDSCGNPIKPKMVLRKLQPLPMPDKDTYLLNFNERINHSHHFML